MIKFEVHGTPIPWKAPVTNRFGGIHGREDMKAWQAAITEIAMNIMGDDPPLDGPIYLGLDFMLDIPGYIRRSKKKHMSALSGDIAPVKRPDLSNFVKCVEDALSGVVFVDDSQVICCHSSKKYSHVSGVVIAVNLAIMDTDEHD